MRQHVGHTLNSVTKKGSKASGQKGRVRGGERGQRLHRQDSLGSSLEVRARRAECIPRTEILSPTPLPALLHQGWGAGCQSISHPHTFTVYQLSSEGMTWPQERFHRQLHPRWHLLQAAFPDTPLPSR